MEIDESTKPVPDTTQKTNVKDRPGTNDTQTPKQNKSDNKNKSNDEEYDDKKPPPRRTNLVKHQHTYRVLIKAYTTEKDQETFNRLQVLNIVLRALQKSDPETSSLVPCDENFMKRVYTPINPDSKNKHEYEKIEKMLHFTNSTSIQGTVQITTNTIYSMIKKNLDTRKALQETIQITLYRNQINAKNLTEVGFFANHLVRHDTVECTKWITKLIPPNSPDFQSELRSFKNLRRKGTRQRRGYDL
jgi:hypothetical protein